MFFIVLLLSLPFVPKVTMAVPARMLWVFSCMAAVPRAPTLTF